MLGGREAVHYPPTSLHDPPVNALPSFAWAGFDLLYTRFAGAYDLVANLVSFGEWREGGAIAPSSIPDEVRVFEIGHGPGHLRARIRARDLDAVGIHLSPQMGRLAWRNLSAAGCPPRLARADVARLPFADAGLWLRGLHVPGRLHPRSNGRG